MTELESVYVTDREELRKQVLDALVDLVHFPDQRRHVGNAVMPAIDHLLEWGNGLAKQAEQFRATAGNLQKLLDASQEALKQQTEQAERIFALCGESPEECSASSLAAFVEEYIGRAQATIEDLNSKQVAPTLGVASREAVEHVIDEHCCSADVTGAIVAKLFEAFHLYPRNPSRLSQAEIDDARRDASQPVEDRGLYREDS